MQTQESGAENSQGNSAEVTGTEQPAGAITSTEQTSAPNGEGAGGLDLGPKFDLSTAVTGLSDENLKVIADKGFDKVDDLGSFVNKTFDAYREIESKIGTGGDLPADATPEQQLEYFAKNRPESAEAYKITKPEGLDESIPYDGDMENKFKSWAHEAGLANVQADMLVGKFMGEVQEKMAAVREQETKHLADAHTKVQSIWGEEGSETYNRNSENARRALQANPDLMQEFQAVGIISSDGMIISAHVADMLAKVGETLGEDPITLTGQTGENAGSGTVSAENPWNPESPNLTAQSDMVKRNPELAKRFIREAGLEESRYF